MYVVYAIHAHQPLVSVVGIKIIEMTNSVHIVGVVRTYIHV